MRTLVLNFGKVSEQVELSDATPTNRAATPANKTDVFESPEQKTMVALKALEADIAGIEKLAHSIGENANEAWIRIWDIKNKLFTACRKYEARFEITPQELTAIGRELRSVDEGLRTLTSRH